MHSPIFLLSIFSFTISSAAAAASSSSSSLIITSPIDGQIVSMKQPMNISYSVQGEMPANSYVALEINEIFQGHAAPNLRQGSFLIPEVQMTKLHIALALLKANQDDEEEEDADDNNNKENVVIARSDVVRCRVAVDAFVHSEHGDYAMWMPYWLAANFEHLIEKDEQGRRVMPPLEQYLTLQDYMLELPKEAMLLDVGAHIGQSALPVAAAGYQVVSVEPIHSSAELLRHNIKESGFPDDRIHVIEAVASNEPGYQTIYVPVMQDNASLSKSAAIANMQDKSVREVRVKKVVLDDWLDQHPDIKSRVQFVKIDTQGFELTVLKGLRKFLAATPSLDVLIEWDERLMRHASIEPKSVEAFFQEFGFSLIEDGGDRLYRKRK